MFPQNAKGVRRIQEPLPWIKYKVYSTELGYIPKILQNAIFGLLLFTPRLRKKVHNRAGYSSLFCEAWTKNQVAQNIAF
jgi:hypothetical protein